MRSLYKALGLAPGADNAQIKSAFRELAKRSHPDINAGETPTGERFKEIHQAYRLLRDPQMRAVLDLAVAQAHATTRRRWLMAMVTMAAAFSVTVGGGLLFLTWPPSPSPQMSMHQLPAPAKGKIPAEAEQLRDAEGREAKPTRKLAAAPAAETPVEKQNTAGGAAAASPSTPAGAVSIEKPPASDKQPRAAEAAALASGVVPPVKEAVPAGKLAAVPAADPPAGEAPGKKQAQVETTPPSAPVGAQADADLLVKRPAPVKRSHPGGTASWAPALTVAPKTTNRKAEWSTYRNDRFGFSLKYPAHVFTPAKGERDDEVLIVSRDGRARLRISGTPFNRTTTTLPAYRQKFMAERYGDAVLDGTPLHKTWFALSGSRGDKKFYARVVCSCDARSLHAWELTYPPSERSFYEPIVEEIRRSYRREGEDDAGHCRRNQA